jgi:hypothetical protein
VGAFERRQHCLLANRIFLTNPIINTQIGAVPEHTLGLSISRSIGGGIHEEIAMRSDFADTFEVKSGDIVRRGRITTVWSQSAARLNALVEIQGYVYDAWLRMAQIYDALGKSARAQTLRERPKPCSPTLTTRSGMKRQASTLSAWMATKSRC